MKSMPKNSISTESYDHIKNIPEIRHFFLRKKIELNVILSRRNNSADCVYFPFIFGSTRVDIETLFQPPVEWRGLFLKR